VSLLVGVLILAAAVFLGGLAAVFRRRSERAMPAVRAFAVVAAASIAVLHLLPEALGQIGWRALLAGAAGFLTPAALERLAPPSRRPGLTHRAPTTALAMGYAAVLAHQIGEGAAVASLARVGSLSASIVLAIAAHTVPLAMVVAIRVLEVKGDAGGTRAMTLALAGVALATIAGAFASAIVGVADVDAIEPWLIAAVAGILLHALSHDGGLRPPNPRHEAIPSGATSISGRTIEASAGILGLVLAAGGVETDGWVRDIPGPLRLAGVALLAALIIARSFMPVRAGERPHPDR
jgi:ZIP family zinc transporter